MRALLSISRTARRAFPTFLLAVAAALLGGCASGVQLYTKGQVTVRGTDGKVTATYAKPVRIASFNSNVRAKKLSYAGPDGIKLEVEGTDDGLMFDNASVVKAWCDGAQGIIKESTTGGLKIGAGAALPTIFPAMSGAARAFAP